MMPRPYRRGPFLVRGFVLLQALLPAEFRARFGAGMEETFADGLGGRRRLRRWWYAVWAYRSLLVTAVKEWVSPSFVPSPARSSGYAATTRWEVLVQSFSQDLRFALRTLWRQPAFAAVAVFTIALGIGATTAMFSVIHGVLLRPLPYAAAHGLIVVGEHDANGPARRGRISKPNLDDIAGLPAVRTLVGYNGSTVTLTGDGDAQVLRSIRVTDGLLGTFGLHPQLGRDLTVADARYQGPRVAVVSDRFWRERLGGRPDVVGSSIEISELAWQVVGVAPPGFGFPDDTQVWRPYQQNPSGCGRGCRTLLTIGSLEAGAELETAGTQVAALSTRLERDFPDSNHDVRFSAVRLRDEIVGDVRIGLLIVLGAVGVVLLIACANVAILLLVRATARQGEIAIRAALGAGRGRLIRQVLLESQVLALTGAAVGLGLAKVALDALKRSAVGVIPRVEAVALDGNVLAFALVTTFVVALLFGSAPALLMSRSGAGGLLAAGRGRSASPGDSRFRNVLLAVELALSVALLTGSGLLLKTFTRLYAVDLGFETREIVRFTTSIPRARYGSLDQVAGFYREVDERIAALPGVASVGAVYGAPMGRGDIWGTVEVEGRPAPSVEEETSAAIRPMTPGFMETMRISMLRGRALTRADGGGAPPVAVVNETFVRDNFPGEEVIGRRVRITASFGYGNPTWTVVGVVRDFRTRSLTQDTNPEIYVPHSQFGPGTMTVSVRSEPGAAPLLPALRAEIRDLDPNVPLRDIETVREAVDRHVAPTRFYLTLVVSFAGVALVLSAVGLYGVVSYLVSRRAREIGIRLALGARARAVVGLVTAQGMRPAVVGLIVGLAGSLAGATVLESLLFEVAPRDPLVFAGVTGLLFAVSLVATWLPARRATRVDPVDVMRVE